MQRIKGTMPFGDCVAFAEFIGAAHHGGEVNFHRDETAKAKVFLERMQAARCRAQRQPRTASTLHRIEICDQNVTIDMLETITDRLKVTLADIFGDGKK